LATILFASASFGGGCSAGVYQQIEKNMQKFFFIGPWWAFLTTCCQKRMVSGVGCQVSGLCTPTA
jgi:hypothetical protein